MQKITKTISKSNQLSQKIVEALKVDTKTLLEHYRQKRFKRAEKLAKSITRKFPKHRFAWKILGAALKQTGRHSESVIASKKSIELFPSDPETHNNLGTALSNLGALDDSIESYLQAIALKPDFAQAHNNLGNSLRKLGKLDEAVSSFKKAITFKPDYFTAHVNLGGVLMKLGQLDEALVSFSKAADLKDDQSVQHLIAALKGKTTTTAPPEYVESLFDDYAESFETSLVQKLEYRTPRIIADLIIKASDQSSLGSVIDLGCGTGLLGEQIEKHCENLEGIDISGKMLEKAQDKNIYRKLIKQDIIEYISNTDLAFDFFIAVDVFVYMGDLSEIFRLIKHRNRNEGKLVFSTEHFPGEGYFLEKTGRYSHSENYIKSLCLEFGYVITHFKIQDIRKDEGRNIRGGIYILEF